MATLGITEFSSKAAVGANRSHSIEGGGLPDVLANNGISLSALSAQSSQLNANTTYVRLCTDTACYVVWSATGTTDATTAGMYVPANMPEYFAVVGGGYLAAIT